MNERMREPFHTLMWKSSIGYNDSWSQVDPEVLEKFAELIVRECATAFEAEVDTWKQMVPYQGSIKRRGTKAIKQHFGVE